MASSARRPLPVRLFLMLASGLCFAVWGLVATLLAWLVLPIVMLAMRGKSRNERMASAQRITAGGNRWLMRLMSWTRLVLFDRQTRLLVPDGPFVLIANHPTLVDVCALTCIQPEMCVIAKPKYSRNPFIGRALRAAGHIEGPRSGSPFGGAAVVAGAVDRLERGFPVLVFPEGRRSPLGSVGSISRGAFEIAKQANVPIVCALITADPPTLSRGMRWYSLPKQACRYKIEARPPVTMAQFDNDSKKAAAHYRKLFTAHISRTTDQATAPAEAAQQAGATS